MILAIDIGNTTVALGGVDDGSVCFFARMDTVRTRTVEEYGREMGRLLAERVTPPIFFEGVVITSVVPQITDVLIECSREYTDTDPLVVSPDIYTGLIMGIPDPHGIGHDRIVDASYAAAHFPLPVITADLGTATTFSVVDENRVFRGGVIACGLATGLNALRQRCAQLPQVQLETPKTVIGQDTVECMLSGAVVGAAAILDGVTARIEEELGRPASLIVTGGAAANVVPFCKHPLTYDPQLLLKGLGYLYTLNASGQADNPCLTPLQEG